MGKKKNQLWVSLKEWSIQVPQRWWDMLNVPLSYIPLVAGVAGFLIWARNIEPPIPLWILIIIPFGTFLFMLVSFLAFHRVRTERDEGKTAQLTRRQYSIVWNTEGWHLQVSNGWISHWENESGGIGLILTGDLVINTFKRILIESVQLDIGGQLFQSDWKSFEYVGYDEPSVIFYVPFDIQRGKRTATLKTIVDGKTYTSDPFMLDVPQGKQVPHIGGSLI